MVYGKTVKKNEKDEVFIRDGWYTPCDCEPGEVPDLYIKSDKMKLTRDLVVTGPFHLVITDVPTPLGLPFGIFPKPSRQNSGIIVPAYGEERRTTRTPSRARRSTALAITGATLRGLRRPSTRQIQSCCRFISTDRS
jgi:hypothetical protein